MVNNWYKPESVTELRRVMQNIRNRRNVKFGNREGSLRKTGLSPTIFQFVPRNRTNNTPILLSIDGNDVFFLTPPTVRRKLNNNNNNNWPKFKLNAFPPRRSTAASAA